MEEKKQEPQAEKEYSPVREYRKFRDQHLKTLFLITAFFVVLVMLLANANDRRDYDHSCLRDRAHAHGFQHHRGYGPGFGTGMNGDGGVRYHAPGSAHGGSQSPAPGTGGTPYLAPRGPSGP